MHFFSHTLSRVVTVLLGLSVVGVAQDRTVGSGTGPSFNCPGPLALGPDGVVSAVGSEEVSV
jgi:hypothetical protein